MYIYVKLFLIFRHFKYKLSIFMKLNIDLIKIKSDMSIACYLTQDSGGVRFYEILCDFVNGFVRDFWVLFPAVFSALFIRITIVSGDFCVLSFQLLELFGELKFICI